MLCAQGHAQDRPDRSTVHPGDQQRWPRGRKRRQAARYAMARGRRRGLARTRKSLPKVGWVGCRRTGAARSTSSQGTKSWCTHVIAQATQWRRTWVYVWAVEAELEFNILGLPSWYGMEGKDRAGFEVRAGHHGSPTARIAAAASKGFTLRHTRQLGQGGRTFAAHLATGRLRLFGITSRGKWLSEPRALGPPRRSREASAPASL